MRALSAKTKKIIAYMQANPNVKVAVIAKKFKTAPTYIYKLRDKAFSAASTAKAIKQATKPLEALGVKWKVASVGTSSKSVKEDMVNHPSHYKTGGIETIDFIEAKELDYHLGNVVKYISRASFKGDKLENLKKAQWYMNRAVSKMESK